MKKLKKFYVHLKTYDLPYTLNYCYSLGFILGLLFTMQIISGLFLIMFYIPDTSVAYQSIGNIMREVNGGWYVRYFHMNGASFIFFLIYCHIAKGLFYATYN
jgi:ubiquinol-cytochrome c reductase cytochrome b subunit